MASPRRNPLGEHTASNASGSTSPQRHNNQGFFSDSKGIGHEQEDNDENVISATHSYSPSKAINEDRNSANFYSSGKSRSMDANMLAAMRRGVMNLIDGTASGTTATTSTVAANGEEEEEEEEETAATTNATMQGDEMTTGTSNLTAENPFETPTIEDLAVLEKPTIVRQQSQVTTIFSSENPFDGLGDSNSDHKSSGSSNASTDSKHEIAMVETVTSEDSTLDNATKATMDHSKASSTFLSNHTFDGTSDAIMDGPPEGRGVFQPPQQVVSKNRFDRFPTRSTDESSSVFLQKPVSSDGEDGVGFHQPTESPVSSEDSDDVGYGSSKSPTEEGGSASSKDTFSTAMGSISATSSRDTNDFDSEIMSNATSDAFSGLMSQPDTESLSEAGTKPAYKSRTRYGPSATRRGDLQSSLSGREDETLTLFSAATDKTPRMNNLETQDQAESSPMSPRDRYLMAIRNSISKHQKACGPMSPRDRYLMAVKQAAEKCRIVISSPREIVTGPCTTPVKAQIRQFDRSPSDLSLGRSPSRSFERSPTARKSSSRFALPSTPTLGMSNSEKDDEEEQPLEFGLALFGKEDSAADLTKEVDRLNEIHAKSALSTFHQDVSRSSSGELPVKEQIDKGSDTSPVKTYLQLDVEAAASNQEEVETKAEEAEPAKSMGPIDTLRSSLAMIWNSKPVPRLAGSQSSEQQPQESNQKTIAQSNSEPSPLTQVAVETSDIPLKKTQECDDDSCCQVPSENTVGAIESLRSSLMTIWNSKPRPAIAANAARKDEKPPFTQGSPPTKPKGSTSPSLKSHESPTKMQDSSSLADTSSSGHNSEFKRGRSEDSLDNHAKQTRRTDGLSARQRPSFREVRETKTSVRVTRLTMGSQYLKPRQRGRSLSRERTVTPIPSDEDLSSPGGLLGDVKRHSYDSLEEELDLEAQLTPNPYPMASSYRVSPKKPPSASASPKRISKYLASPKPLSSKPSLSPSPSSVKPTMTTDTENSFINAALKARNVNDVVVIYSGTPETRDWHPPEQERKEHDTMVRAILERPSLIDKSIREPFQPKQLDWRDVRKWTVATMLMLFFVAVIAGCLACGITGNCARRDMNVAEEEKEFQPLVLDLPDYTQESLKSLHTAQTKAYFWLEKDPYRNAYSDERKMQRFALATLYYSTKIAQNWTVSTSWLSYDIHECFWFSSYEGMDVCEDEKIKHLVLKKNNLRGNIPPEIAFLTSLVELDLSRNVLFGPIPEQLKNLTSLEQLWLEKNELNGGIPSEIGALTKLTSLALATNDLKGSIPREVAQLTNLRALRLFYNFLTGTVPSEIARLTKLELLDVDVNNLSGSIPTELGSLSNLKELWLDWNSFVGPIPTELGHLENLRKLYLGRAFVGEDLRDDDWKQSGDYLIPTELGMLTNLEELYLDNNDLTGVIPTELSALTNLQRATLDNNYLKDTISPGVCSLFGGQLESLSVDCSEVLCSCGCTCA